MISLENKAKTSGQISSEMTRAFQISSSAGRETQAKKWVRLEDAQLYSVEQLGIVGRSNLEMKEEIQKLKNSLEAEKLQREYVVLARENLEKEIECLEGRLEQARQELLHKINFMEYEKVHGNLNEFDYHFFFKKLLGVLEGSGGSASTAAASEDRVDLKRLQMVSEGSPSSREPTQSLKMEGEKK